MNENHKDNRPENLVPLYPTHHQYVHSRYKDEVLPAINQYLQEYMKAGIAQLVEQLPCKQPDASSSLAASAK